jgi:Uncharacterised protein family, YAP/Alf4/glomulin
MTYATILDMHLANASSLPADAQNAILTTLEGVLNDPENGSLVQGIAWDIVTMLLAFLGRQSTEKKANEVLTIVGQNGNAKEVFLKCNEALKQIQWRADDLDEYDDSETTIAETLKNMSNEDEENNPVKQMIFICRATNMGMYGLGSQGPDGSIQTNSDESAVAVSYDIRGGVVNCRLGGFSIACRNGGPHDRA